MKSHNTLLYAALLLLGACSKSDTPTEPGPNVILTLVQKDIKIPDATVKLIYDDNGQTKTLSAVTGADGKVSLDAPLNKQIQMTITSKCGILLYDWKAGPFSEIKGIDTTLSLNAYSPDCETSAPDQYVTTNTFGVISRWTSFDSNFGFWLTSAEVATYVAEKKDKSAKIYFEMSVDGLGTGLLGIESPIGNFYSGSNKPTYFEKGDYGQYVAANFTSMDNYVYGGHYNEFPDELLTGTFRFIRHHYKEDSNWPMFFPE